MSWRDLVRWPSEDESRRRRLCVWQWFLVPGSFALLWPVSQQATSTFVQIILPVPEETVDDAHLFDDTPRTRVKVVGTGEETTVPNALFMCCATRRETEVGRVLVPMPPKDAGSAYADWYRRYSESSGPVLPRQEDEATFFTSDKPAELAKAIPPRVFVPETQVRSAPTEPVASAEPVADNELEIEHTTSGARKRIRLINVLDGSVLVEWPMAGMYELRKTKKGAWISSPRSLLNSWKIAAGSLKTVELRMAEVRTRKLEERRKQIFGES